MAQWSSFRIFLKSVALQKYKDSEKGKRAQLEDERKFDAQHNLLMYLQNVFTPYSFVKPRVEGHNNVDAKEKIYSEIDTGKGIPLAPWLKEGEFERNFK